MKKHRHRTRPQPAQPPRQTPASDTRAGRRGRAPEGPSGDGQPAPDQDTLASPFEDLLLACPEAFRSWFESPGLPDPEEVEAFQRECVSLLMEHAGIGDDPPAWSLIRDIAHAQVEAIRFRSAGEGIVVLSRQAALEDLLLRARAGGPDEIRALAAAFLSGDERARGAVAHVLAQAGLSTRSIGHRALEMSLAPIERLHVMQRKVEERLVRLRALWMLRPDRVQQARPRIIVLPPGAAPGPAGPDGGEPVPGEDAHAR